MSNWSYSPFGAKIKSKLMFRKKNKKGAKYKEKGYRNGYHRLHPDTKSGIWAIVLVGIAAVLALAAFGKAGPLGDITYSVLHALLGWGYFILPAALVFAAAVFLITEKQRVVSTTLLGSGLLILSVLGLIEIISPGNGGWLGLVLGSLRFPFGETTAIVINILVLIIAVLVAANAPIKIGWPQRERKEESPHITGADSTGSPQAKAGEEEAEASKGAQEKAVDALADDDAESAGSKADSTPSTSSGQDGSPQDEPPSHFKPHKPKSQSFGNYVPPPLSLLKSASEKPRTGDLLASANIIKRTLDGFGIPVEMGEINVGPSVTRYTLKPAEGVKLTRIIALNQDLALALAAHPIRIEAPIPGKSLVGIEVPNKAAALVRLGTLMAYPDFQKSGPLGFSLGRDVSGEPIFENIDSMPHLLVAGATGAGKSILIHSLLISLLYKNSPATLRLILIDPKRVELSVYEGLPHLVSPVIVDSKKAVGVFKWAIHEMERRYDILLKAGSRDIKGYNANGHGDVMPYLLIVIDELADLMTSYGREVEGSVVRLAQMARATGLHLILSTQRPSVEVITGLIKANITSRVALQVASQVDSRTILDTAGADKLLGHGDLLYISSELSKPKRIQGAFISEEEINKVTNFIRHHNKAEAGEDEAIDFSSGGEEASSKIFDDYLEDDEDELYDDAVRVVVEAKKASASLLQRRLKVGYARAARLLDLMEANGLIGPGEGAKPREVFLDRIEKL